MNKKLMVDSISSFSLSAVIGIESGIVKDSIDLIIITLITTIIIPIIRILITKFVRFLSNKKLLPKEVIKMFDSEARNYIDYLEDRIVKAHEHGDVDLVKILTDELKRIKEKLK